MYFFIAIHLYLRMVESGQEDKWKPLALFIFAEKGLKEL